MISGGSPLWTSRHFLLALLLPALISSLDDDVHQQSIGSESFRFGKTDGLQNVTVQVGSSAYLHCPVINLGEKELSWVRRSDWHILSHGTRMFTKDDRFQLVPDPPIAEADDFGQNNLGRQDWTLMIKFVTARDSGIYECQVTSEKGIRSHRVDLKVETPEAFILAEDEYHIERGSSLSLVCIIEKATEPPQYVFWYHNQRMINFDSERGIAVTTTPGRRTHSQLSISKAEVSDSGNYTCAPSNSSPASIQVYVSGSEVKPWTSDASISLKPNPGLPLFCLQLLLLIKYLML